MSILRVILSCFVLLIFSISYADTVTETVKTTTTNAPATTTAVPNITSPAPSPASVGGRAMIVTPVPTAKEEIATPEGFVNCFTVEAGWYKDAWVPEHRICQYEATPGQTVTYEGVAWVDSYWACTKYTGTACTAWEWKPGHWVKTLEVY